MENWINFLKNYKKNKDDYSYNLFESPITLDLRMFGYSDEEKEYAQTTDMMLQMYHQQLDHMEMVLSTEGNDPEHFDEYSSIRNELDFLMKALCGEEEFEDLYL